MTENSEKFQEFLKSSKKFFRPKIFFNILLIFFSIFNAIFLSLLMYLSNNALPIMIFIFLIVFGTVATLQGFLLKIFFSWKKKRVKDEKPDIYKEFENSLKNENLDDKFIKKCVSWRNKTYIISVLRGVQILSCILLLLMYIPLIISFNSEIIEMRLSKKSDLIESTIMSFLLSFNFLFLYFLIFLLIFLFDITDSYMNRFRWIIEAIILEHYNDLEKSRNEIISEKGNNIVISEKLDDIKTQLDSILSFHLFEILGILRNPEFAYKLRNLFKKYDLTMILKDYEIYLDFLRNNQVYENEINNINQCIEYHKNIKYRIHKEKHDLKLLISEGETENIEFKSSLRYDYDTKAKNRKLEHEVIKTIAGFLNKKGGTLFIGVNDNGSILGLENDYKLFKSKQNKDTFILTLSHIIDNNFTKDINVFLDKSIEILENKEICVVNVSQSNQPIFLKNGDFYIRSGGETKPLNPEKQKDYIATRFS